MPSEKQLGRVTGEPGHVHAMLKLSQFRCACMDSSGLIALQVESSGAPWKQKEIAAVDVVAELQHHSLFHFGTHTEPGLSCPENMLGHIYEMDGEWCLDVFGWLVEALVMVRWIRCSLLQYYGVDTCNYDFILLILCVKAREKWWRNHEKLFSH